MRIQRGADGFRLHHVDDLGRPDHELRRIQVCELRSLAQTTAHGSFRPIKTAPTLRSGWSALPATAQQLERGLDALYPGALVDWFAAQNAPVPIQHYREFTARQTGMYRVTQQLNDLEVAAVVRAGCHAQFCLRKRFWTVDGLNPDDTQAGKSSIPCLEPCPLILELARRGRRLEQEARTLVPMVADDVTTLVQALDVVLTQPTETVREGDLADPANPRRIRLLRDRLAGLLPAKPPSGSEA